MVIPKRKTYKKQLTIEFTSCNDCIMRRIYDYGTKTMCHLTKSDITKIKTIKRNCPLFKESE
jgi:hypothetical protein